jgi:hypothetical protein
MGWTAGVRFLAGAKDFLFSTAPRPALGPHPASYPLGTGALSPGVKRLGREADHSPPSSAEIENGGAIPPLSTRFHDVVLN